MLANQAIWMRGSLNNALRRIGLFTAALILAAFFMVNPERIFIVGTSFRDVDAFSGEPYECRPTSSNDSIHALPSQNESLPPPVALSFALDDPFEIRLKSRRFTPPPGIASGIARQSAETASGGKSYAIAQFQEIPGDTERRMLAEMGISLLRYIPQRAWIVSGTNTALASLEGVESVRWVGRLSANDKIDPALNDSEPWAIDPNTGEVTVIVQLMADAAIDEGIAIVQARGGEILSHIQTINSLVVSIPRAELIPLASENVIEWIEQVPPPLSPNNDCARETMKVNQLHDTPFSLDGSGVNVLVFDSGTVSTSHPAFEGRLTIGDSTIARNHSTHVAGTLGGDGTGSPGTRDLKGVAPGVNIISYGVEIAGAQYYLYSDPVDIEADWNEAKNTHGADIGNASIGANVAFNQFPCEFEGDYGATAQLIDSIVRGQFGEPFISIWANGNERSLIRCGTEYFSTSPPANAKNPINVGATYSDRDVIAYFSGWGPSDDGRVKPTISAPGCETSESESSINSTLPPDRYGGLCGTSMATPAVTGVIALMLQQYRQTFSTDGEFLPSTAKAALIHTAVDIEQPGPDYRSGYGRVDAFGAVNIIRNNDFLESVIDDQGEVDVHNIKVNPGSGELKVSLAWDDFPASLQAAAQLVNDLDLTVVSPDSTVHTPWILDPQNPDDPATNGADHLNNQEQVVVDNPPPGLWEIHVAGTAIPEPSQTYSLVFTSVETVIADLSIAKSASDDAPGLNDEFIYTIVASNGGPDDATGVIVNDKLPVGVFYVSDDSAGAYDPASGVWAIGDLPNGAIRSLEITAAIDTDTTDSRIISNTASMVAANLDDPSPVFSEPVEIQIGVCGDQNFDDAHDLDDAEQSLAFIVESQTPKPLHTILGDLNRDTEINILDAITSLKHVAEQTDIAECGVQ